MSTSWRDRKPVQLETPEQQAAIARVEGELAEIAGHLNVLHGRLVQLMVESLDQSLWGQWGISSPGHWLAWQTGLSPRRARDIVEIAERVDELPECIAGLVGGELTIDQLAVIAPRVPAHNDAELAVFAKDATVGVLRRTVSKYPWINPPKKKPEPEPTRTDDAVDPDPEPSDDPEPAPDVQSERQREAERIAMAVGRVAHGWGEDGRFFLHADLPADQGAIVMQAMAEARDRLFRAGDGAVTWCETIVDVAGRSLAAIENWDRRDRFRTYLHLDTNGASINGGPSIPRGLFEQLTCDGVMRPVWETDGIAVSVGRLQHEIPMHTRRMVLHRDEICRYPGCTRRHGLQVHHIQHWSKDGPTDIANLAAFCTGSRGHHEAAHRGEFTVEGNADDADGLTFRAPAGWVIRGYTPPPAPTGPPPSPPDGARFERPSGEPLDRWSVAFCEPPSATEAAA